MTDHDEILIVAHLGAAPDEDAADVEQGVIEVNRVLASIGTLRPLETAPRPLETPPHLDTAPHLETAPSPPPVSPPEPVPPAPGSTRGVDLAALGTVCASVLPLVPDLLATVRSLLDWAARRPGRTAAVQRADGSRIELTGLSAEDLHLLVTDWVESHPRA
ncbi:hypothetical protein ACNTMW_21550 [Planosporangium sp. 12N6]|uniref:hypothetical protein n=1 Tax=Planosporangium spinosum TaxID=3402278 RepID=UPI003CECBEEB